MPRRGKARNKRGRQDGTPRREAGTRPGARGAHGEVLDLHRSAGNEAVRGLLASADERIPHAADAAPAAVDAVRAAEGTPLDPAVRAELEPLVGDDLGDLRVHADPAAAASAEAVAARAYTSGRDLVFGPGEYAPETAEGRSLIAHEVGHAVAAGPGTPGAPVLRQPKEEGKPGAALLPKSTVPPPQVMTIARSTVATIHFGHDAFLMDTANFAAVEKLAEQLSFMAQPLVSVDGHASTEGPPKRNDQLARMRRETVIAILRSKAKGSFDVGGSAHGAAQPAVPENATSPAELEAQQALNRRAEIVLTDLAAPKPAAGEAPKATGGPLFPALPPKSPPLVPAAPVPQPQAQPKGAEGPTKPGGIGDLAKALSEVDAIKRLIDEFKEQQLHEVGKLSTPEKIITGATAATIVGGAVAGIATTPGGRKALLELADGKELPVPGVPWLKLQIITKGGPGGELKVDVLKLIRGK